MKSLTLRISERASDRKWTNRFQGRLFNSSGPEGVFKDRRRLKERSRCFSCSFIFVIIFTKRNMLSAKISKNVYKKRNCISTPSIDTSNGPSRGSYCSLLLNLATLISESSFRNLMSLSIIRVNLSLLWTWHWSRWNIQSL